MLQEVVDKEEDNYVIFDINTCGLIRNLFIAQGNSQKFTKRSYCFSFPTLFLWKLKLRMNGCKFLREKGDSLNWDHQQLFPYFKSKIDPFMSNIKETCLDMLEFFHSLQNYNLKLSAEIEKHYEKFIDIYHYQQFVDINQDIIPPIEVQLMWITHCLNPVEYFNDCFTKYQKLLNVNIISISTKTYQTNGLIPKLNEFDFYLKTKLNANIFNRISNSMHTKTTTTTNSFDTKKDDQNQNQNQWFIHNLHMKNSILQQIEFINQINYIQENININNREIYKSIDRYYKFLYLMALPMDKRPPICVPTIDIDLIWHSHILNFNNYYLLSKFLYPQIDIIPHNHSMSQIQEKQNKQKTQIFWDQIFGKNDYWNGRPFYIKITKINKSKRRRKHNKVNSNNNNNNNNNKQEIPQPPVVLMVPISVHSLPSQSPNTLTSTYMITPIPNTNTPIDDNDIYGIEEKYVDKPKMSDDKPNIEGDNDNNINGNNNCLDINEELCIDCCYWTFKKHRNENVCMICGITLCVILLITMLGIFTFSSKTEAINILEFILVSFATIFFVFCTCYGCWWIMYLFDNSFCCDLCDII